MTSSASRRNRPRRFVGAAPLPLTATSRSSSPIASRASRSSPARRTIRPSTNGSSTYSTSGPNRPVGDRVAGDRVHAVRDAGGERGPAEADEPPGEPVRAEGAERHRRDDHERAREPDRHRTARSRARPSARAGTAPGSPTRGRCSATPNRRSRRGHRRSATGPACRLPGTPLVIIVREPTSTTTMKPEERERDRPRARGRTRCRPRCGSGR